MKRRREFLATLGATTTALTAGCLGESSSSNRPVRVMQMLLINFARSPADIDIELIRDGDTVFEETFELSATDEDESSRQISPEPGTELGRYECLVEVNIRETALESSFDTNNRIFDPNACIEINPIINPPGYSREPGPSLSLGVGQINNRYNHPLCE